ncbi:MAG: TM0106 family RecB-like putative nuclease [Fervidobacterium sp.]|nr:TM0106 family RecB-like putative nuclease [Fervidobacterium sp.]
MIITNKDIKTLYFCQKKCKIDILSEKRYLSNYDFATEAFGCTLCVDADEVIYGDKITIRMKKSGKRLSEYHMLEGAFIGYVIESNEKEVSEIIFESPYYSVSINWKPYVTKLLSLLSMFCETMEFKITKNHLCRLCKYAGECFHETVSLDSLAFIHGIRGKTVEKLRMISINNLSDIIVFEDAIRKEFGEEKANKLIYHAKSILEKKPIVFKPIQKLSEGIYLDIESYTPFDFDYLFGVLENDRYIPFLASEPSKERYIFENILKFLEKRQKPVYHFHNYEIARFRKLSKKYNIPISKSLLSRFVDVYKVYVNHVALPIPSYSLKTIARFFGFNWRTDINGMTVIDYYREYIATKDKEILREILKYNEDDVRATKFIVEHLNNIAQ